MTRWSANTGPRQPLRARLRLTLHSSRGRQPQPAHTPPAGTLLPDVVPNTMRALRVTELARERGLHRYVHDRLMRAYWEEGRNIGDSTEVLALSIEAGLDEKQAAEVIEGDAYQERVLASTAQAQSIGITGIPAFLLDGRFLVLGAQPREVFKHALEQLEA